MNAGNVYVCAGCNKLAISERSHRTTCCGACRVRAHRNGALSTIKIVAKTLDITPASILQAKAIGILRPDLAAQIEAGKLTIEAARPDACNAFWKVLRAQIEAVA